MKEMLGQYETVLIVDIDHVSSGQLAQIRKQLRVHEAVVLMGKNTLMRKVIAGFLEEHPDHNIGQLGPQLVGNCGLVFVRKNLNDVRAIIKKNVKAAPAKVGQVAENNVMVPPGPTGCDPGQTSWFQALNVPTKIVKGQIEIVSELMLVKKGEKVYMNGSIFDCAVLDISDDVVRTKFIAGIRLLAAVSSAVGYPTQASLPHALGKAARNLLAICAETKYTFKYSAPWDKLFSMSPEELAKLAASAAPAAGAAVAEAAPIKEEKKEEPADMGGGADLFGGSGGKY
ncbi:hypothetical protein BASA81_000136 [Batrachochytrium salamandrivorans]|nr:hypothetical protein BASA81_000136 [Batrachochytrium salamandrivorans]